MPTRKALQCAHLIDTVNGKVLGATTIKDLGSFAAGKIADVVAVPGKPINDISLM